MGPDHAISVMRVKTAQFDSTIKPQFKKTPRGLLLSSYQAIYRGATPAEATDLDVTIDYQESTACNFPRKSLLLAPTAKLPSKSISPAAKPPSTNQFFSVRFCNAGLQPGSFDFSQGGPLNFELSAWNSLDSRRQTQASFLGKHRPKHPSCPKLPAPTPSSNVSQR